MSSSGWRCMHGSQESAVRRQVAGAAITPWHGAGAAIYRTGCAQPGLTVVAWRGQISERLGRFPRVDQRRGQSLSRLRGRFVTNASWSRSPRYSGCRAGAVEPAAELLPAGNRTGSCRGRAGGRVSVAGCCRRIFAAAVRANAAGSMRSLVPAQLTPGGQRGQRRGHPAQHEAVRRDRRCAARAARRDRARRRT